MSKLHLVVVLAAMSAPIASLAFDLGTAVRSYNTTQDAIGRGRTAEHRLVEQLARKIDNGDETFVTDGTRKERVASRFERALSESGLIPSRTQQVTNVVRVEQGDTVAYELWVVSLFPNRDGVLLLAGERYFLLCDKKIIGASGSVYYNMKEGVRTLDQTYLMTTVHPESEYYGGAKKAYTATCAPTKPKEE